MTSFVSSGDSGAAGCDSASAARATHALGVNGLCSSPYATCVGGTQFADTTNPTLYWSSRNTAGTFASALSYIPEAAWNESASGGLWSTGGGASILYPKPAWQSAPGVPADGHRDVPDVSLTAASHDGYLVMMNGSLYVFAGTSASSPALAAIMALNVQKQNAWQGNANPKFYALATRQASGGAAVFHDVTSGSKAVPGIAGYNATAGYDLATGLGTVDALVMVNRWTDGAAAVPSFQLGASSTTPSVRAGTSTTVALTLSVAGGFKSAVTLGVTGVPTGSSATFAPASLSNTAPASTLTIVAGARSPAGTYKLNVTANGGGITFVLPLTLTITPACTYALDATKLSAAYGAATYNSSVASQGGCAWTAVSTVTWIKVSTGAGGSGNGTVSYAVAANPATTVRTGVLTIAGQTVTVTQAAAPPPFTLKSTSGSLAAGGGTGTVDVTTTLTTAWSASASASWITLTSGAAVAVGSRSVGYRVAANPLSSSRTANIAIGGIATYALTQAGTPCGYSLTLGLPRGSASGITDSVAVSTTATDCTWSTSSNVAWITISAGRSGTGNGVVSFVIASNPSATQRKGRLTVGGKAITVLQSQGNAISISML